MADKGQTTADSREATILMGGFVRRRNIALGLIAAIALAVAGLSADAAQRAPGPLAASLAPSSLVGAPMSSNSHGPIEIGTAWSMPPLPEPPTYVSSAIEQPPLTRASSISSPPR